MNSEFHCALSDQEISEYRKQIQDRIKAESILAGYNYFLISTCRESCPLPVDSCEPKEDNRTSFKILLTCDHLCATSLSCVKNDNTDYNHNCCNLVNIVEQHVCNNYCSKKGSCWFSYPKPIVSCLHAQILEKNSDSNDGKPPDLYRKIEFCSNCNVAAGKISM